MNTDAKNYITTKEQCQSLIDKYNCVCNQCGGKIEPAETVDNIDRPTYWAACLSCGIYTHGVDLETHLIAKFLVDEKDYVPYRHMDKPQKEDTEKYEHWRRSQIAGACYTVRDVIGYYKELQEGKKVPINAQKQ